MNERAARMCPICGEDSRVYRGADSLDGVFVRRRKCLKCDAEFETLEVFSGYVKKSAKISKSAVSDGQDGENAVKSQ